ncbi:MAG TPA: dephospho-CoA kinase [Candidatus Kapabacteria bacterium]|nr:dephospho-CoA kinase [Candidatus Kapabacteria bacterium]
MLHSDTPSPLLQPRAFRLGITGKISSGKTTFSAMCRSHGISVIDTDELAKEVMSSDPGIREALISILGDDAYNGSSLNKKFIAEKIFSDEDVRRSVQDVVHPAVMHTMESKFQQAPAGSVIAAESALFIQTGYDTQFDLMVIISSTDENIIARNRESKKFQEDDLKTRLNEQDYSPEIEELCDIVIDNNSSMEFFLASCEKIIGIINMLAQNPLPEQPLRTEENDSE